MVLVLLKKILLGESDDKKSLLPSSHSYNSVSSNDTVSQSSYCSTKDGGWVSPRVMSDAIIGLSDGLTVPFALTAGLSSLGDSKLVITGGLAELVSGAISMGLGGYLAAKSELEYYNFQVEKEKEAFVEAPCETTLAIQEVLAGYKLSPDTIKGFVEDMQKHPDDMIGFVVKFARGLEEPADGREITSALTIGLAYFFGGFIPLIPYFFSSTVDVGLFISVIVMIITLFAFGSIKTIASLGTDCGKWCIITSGLKMTVAGGTAAAAAWGLVKAIE